MTRRLVTAPLQEPVTLAEAKAHLRLEEAVDDVYVQALITAARQYIEKVCWRGLLTQTWQLELGGFRGEDKLELAPSYGPGGGNVGAGFTPVVSTVSRYQPFLELVGGHLATAPAVAVEYLDPTGALQALAAPAYVVQGAGDTSRCGRLWPNSAAGYSWPDTLDRFDAVRLTYTLGWSTATLPRPLVQAVLLLLSQMYEYRTPEVTGTIATTLEFTIDALTAPYRLVRL